MSKDPTSGEIVPPTADENQSTSISGSTSTDAPIEDSDSIEGETPTDTPPVDAAKLDQPAPATGIPVPIDSSIEEKKLILERYKARLDFWKFVLGSVIAGIVIATIPPLFKYATTALEIAKSNAERDKEEQDFRNKYVKDFIDKALDQDIENRIRLAQYFSNVTTEEFKAGWNAYLKLLTDRRNEIFASIDKIESDLFEKSQDRKTYGKEIEALNRQLRRINHELGTGDVQAADKKPDLQDQSGR